MDNPLIPAVKYATLVVMGDGVTTEWEFNFAGGYIAPEHVKAFTEDLTTGELVIRPLTLTQPNTAQIVPAVADGLRLFIYRDTPKTEPLVDYTSGSILNESSLDKSNKQAVFIAAELADRVIADYDFSNALLYAVTTATSASQVANGIDAKATTALSNSTTALGLATAAEDVTSKLPTSLGAGLIGWLRNAANAVLRTVADKLSDVVSVKDFGAVGDGVTDDSTAIRRATATGKSVYFPAGQYRMLSTVEHTGRVVWYCYGDATIISDIDVLIVTSGKNSRVTDLDLVAFTEPEIITRDDFGNLIGGLHRGGLGYQPTVNDGDIWPTLTPAQQAQDIGPKIAFKGNASNICVSGLTGDFLSIMLLDTTNSRVRDCSFRAGRNFAGGIVFWNIDGQAGNNNKATNNVVSYASNSGIIFARNFNGSAIGNTISYVGESGIKTYQNDIGAVDARCYRMLVNDNTISFPQYDGIDLANDYPVSGLRDSRHIAVGNDVYGAGQTGLHIDGFYCLVASNRFRACGSNGMYSILNKSKVHGNELIDNNARNTAGKNHMDVVGDGNSIIGNSIVTAGRVGAALYAPGTNHTKNNSSIDGAMFFGNIGSVTSTLLGNTDSLPTHVSTSALRQRQSSFGIPGMEVYTEGALSSGSINFHPLHQQVRNPSVEIRGYCSNAVDTQEYGVGTIGVAVAGAMTEGFRVQSHSSVGAAAFPVMSAPAVPLNPEFLELPGQWSVALEAGRIAFSIKTPGGATKMAYLTYAP